MHTYAELCLQVKGFPTRNESDLAMFNSGSDTVLGAVHFYKDVSTSQISFVVQSNASVRNRCYEHVSC